MTILYIYLALLGLILGSFYNVVGLRVPLGQSVVKPRSHCSNCKRTLTGKDLVPVFSYLFLKGACRTCGQKISILYPAIELATSSLFIFSLFMIGWNKELVIALTLTSLLVIIFITDIHYMIIPDRILLFFAPIFIILRLFIPLTPWWSMFVGAAIGFVLLFLIAVISRGGMGGGDIKLFAVLGLVLGWKGVLLAFFFSTFFGAVLGIVGILIGKVKRGEPMPFGPYIVLGTLTSYFFGEQMLNWYFQFLL